MKTYYVRHFTKGGWNYKDTAGCPWKEVQKRKRIARLLGERIEYEEEESN